MSVKKLFIIIILCALVIGEYFLVTNILKSKKLVLTLNGDSVININYKDEYIDEGAKASFKDEDLTNNIEVSTNLDLEHVGSYSYTYKVKYGKITKEIVRKVNVLDSEKPKLTLNGRDVIIVKGKTYKEKGAKATDNYDGDLTDKVVVESDVDNNKVGEYTVTYKVKDSSGNEDEVKRNVKVVEKANDSQTVPVLNYHFFYIYDYENCNENICLHMDKFNQQLEYLKNNGYYTLTIDEFVDWMYGDIEIPPKSVLLTIDDGAHGTSTTNGNHLIPALEKYEMHATLFLISGWWPKSEYESPYLDVESHTHTLHFEARCGYRSKVNCVSYEDLLADLKESINTLGSSTSFCFPFYESTDMSIKAVKEAGFKVSFVGGGYNASRSDDKYRIPRYPVWDSTTFEEFKEMVEF